MHNGNLVKQRKTRNFHHYAGKKLCSAINSVLAVFKGFALYPLLLQCYCLCVKTFDGQCYCIQILSEQLRLLNCHQFQTLTLVSSSWDCRLHRSLCCICNGRQSQHRALKPDSRLLRAWHWVRLEPLDIRSCSKPRGKTTAHPPSTPTCRCHLRARSGGEGVLGGGRFNRIQEKARLVIILQCSETQVWTMFDCYMWITECNEFQMMHKRRKHFGKIAES